MKACVILSYCDDCPNVTFMFLKIKKTQMCSVSFFLCGDTSMSFVVHTVFCMVIGVFEILSFSCTWEVSDGGQLL